jgi:hypothetical protein
VDFDNQSGLGADLFRGDLPAEDATLAVVVAKACGVFDVAGHMRWAFERALPIRQIAAPHEFGHIPGDLAIRKAGVDVVALGKAYHPRIEGGPRSRVSVRVGGEERSVEVFGERVWYRAGEGRWAISEPEPFSLMELTWANAFGGASFDEFGNPCPHSLNQEGKGFIACEDAVADTALPNVEDPEHSIHDWQDQPRPCNIAPAPRPIAFDLAGELPAIERVREQRYVVPDAFWNDAVPRFRFPALAPGEVVTLCGMYERPLHMAAPQFRVEARLTLGARMSVIPLAIDTVLFCPETQHCEVTWRASFKYRFVPRETRALVLRRVGQGA